MQTRGPVVSVALLLAQPCPLPPALPSDPLQQEHTHSRIQAPEAGRFQWSPTARSLASAPTAQLPKGHAHLCEPEEQALYWAPGGFFKPPLSISTLQRGKPKFTGLDHQPKSRLSTRMWQRLRQDPSRLSADSMPVRAMQLLSSSHKKVDGFALCQDPIKY